MELRLTCTNLYKTHHHAEPVFPFAKWDEWHEHGKVVVKINEIRYNFLPQQELARWPQGATFPCPVPFLCWEVGANSEAALHLVPSLTQQQTVSATDTCSSGLLSG